jgi:hypothetical protein
MLQDIAGCAALRELHLSLAGPTWGGLGQQCRQQLVALGGQQGMRRCTIEGMHPE